MQYTEILLAVKFKIKLEKKNDNFTQKIDCEYTLDLLRRGGSIYGLDQK